MVATIGIYVDDGAEFETLLREVMKEVDHSRARVLPVLAENIIHEPSLFDEMAAFVMPGGADLPYCAKLNGAGNRRIRKYVERGGHYLGFCAGAYYACRTVEFHKGRSDEVSGPRELGLIEAVAIGSLGQLGPLYDLTIRGASAPRIDWKDIGLFRGYYNGGPRFELPDSSTANVIASYFDVPGNAPAVVSVGVGEGSAILTGVHLEKSAETLLLALAQLTDGGPYRHLAELLRDHETARGAAFRSLLELSNIPLKPAAVAPALAQE